MFNWYRVFNLQAFLDSGLVSKEATLAVDGTGDKEILITRGNTVSMLVDDLLLPLNLNAKNPFRFGERAIFLDTFGDVWLGVYSAD